MELERARALQGRVLQHVLQCETARRKVRAAARNIFVRGLSPLDDPKSVAMGESLFDKLGIAISALGGDAKNGHSLSIFVQDRRLMGHDLLNQLQQAIRTDTQTDADVVYTGPFKGLLWSEDTTQPLRMGCSIGTPNRGRGTLGCFVEDKKTQELLILSNQHVLAKNVETTSNAVDVNQPHAAAQGRKVGKYVRGVPIRFEANAANLMDCAVAKLELDPSAIKPADVCEADGAPLPMLFARKTIAAANGMPVKKVGASTGLTTGKVIALEVVNIGVALPDRIAQFSHQIAFESDTQFDFADAGDSGSVIMDMDHKALALLFARSEPDQPGGKKIALGSPIDAVLDKLGVRLI